MFEEVPRTRRGLAALTTRHIVLGPFVLGGGLLLAAVGGSVAVAATVITASTIHSVNNDVPPRPAQLQVAPPSRSTGHHHRAAAPAPSSHPSGGQHRVTAAAPRSVAPSPTLDPAGAPATTSQPATPRSSGPAGNALIYVDGFDRSAQRLLFQFAVVDSGTDGNLHYRVGTPQQYSATLASDVTITSAGTVCPPAGRRCTVAQLATASDTGFYAVAAIDPTDQVHSLIEVDSAQATFGPAVSPSSTAPPSSSPPSSAAPAGSGAAPAAASQPSDPGSTAADPGSPATAPDPSASPS